MEDKAYPCIPPMHTPPKWPASRHCPVSYKSTVHLNMQEVLAYLVETGYGIFAVSRLWEGAGGVAASMGGTAAARPAAVMKMKMKMFLIICMVAAAS